MPPQALKIVYLSDNDDGQFVIDTIAFKRVLEKVGDHPFILYSINGRTRDGKSYVLNHFIRYLNHKTKNSGNAGSSEWFSSPIPTEFISANGRGRVTSGINLWSEPFFDTRAGKKVAILLMDCQGLFDDQTTPQQNAIIFSLSNLLSSVMIFNVMKMVDETTFQQLHFYSEYTRAISSPSYDDENCLDDEPDQFQQMIILIRDFQFDDYAFGYYDERTCPRSVEYSDRTKNFFHDTMNNSKVVPENMAVRNRLRSFFANISMFLLPHPGSSFLKNPLTSSPDEDFKDHLKEFIILMNTDTHSVFKKIGGQVVTGLSFIPYVESWNKKCQESATQFPNVKDIRETTIQMQFAMALSTSLALFTERLKDFMERNYGVSDELLFEQYEAVLEETTNVFKKIPKLGGNEIQKSYLKELREECSRQYETYKTVNDSKREMQEARAKFLEEQDKSNKELESLGNQIRGLNEAAAESQRKFYQILEENEKERKALQETQRIELEKFQREMEYSEEKAKLREDQFSKELQQLKNEQAERERKFEADRKRIEEDAKRKSEQLERDREIRRQQAEDHQRQIHQMQQKIVTASASAVTRRRKSGWCAFRDSVLDVCVIS